MTNFNKPDLSSREVDAIDEYKARDVSIAQMFDVGTNTNIPENSIRFNVVAGVFQRRESGSWVTKTLSNDALGDVLTGAGSFGSSIAIPQLTINSKGRVTAAGTNTVRSASTSQTGIVQLNNTTTSTSTTQAGTANSVKLTKEAADSAQSSADSAQSSANSAQSSADAASNKATPKTLTGATTNSSDGSGHTHNITGSDAINENNSNQLATSAAVNSLRLSVDRYEESAEIEVGGDFDAGVKVRFVRYGRIVIMEMDFGNHVSKANPSSSQGIVPESFRPSSVFRPNVYSTSDDFSAKVSITSNFGLTINYWNYTGPVSRTNTEDFVTLSYLAAP